METTNQIQKSEHKRTAISLLNEDQVKSKFKEILGNKAQGFITSVLSAVQSSDKLKKATPESVYMAAMMAAALDLPVNQNLGFAYIIPYNSKIKDKDGKEVWVQVAQFQIGYKGFIQLAQRSGQYKTISVAEIYEGQLVSQDPLRGFEFDWKAKKSDKIIGFAGFFALVNGFEKTLYMTVEELQAHGKTYSKTYSDSGSRWKTDFETMAKKTVIKLLISKYGPLSVDTVMQKAIASDQSIINDAETMDVTYVDANAPQQLEEQISEEKPDKKEERILALIESASTMDELNKVRKNCTTNRTLDALLAKETQLEAHATEAN